MRKTAYPVCNNHLSGLQTSPVQLCPRHYIWWLLCWCGRPGDVPQLQVWLKNSNIYFDAKSNSGNIGVMPRRHQSQLTNIFLFELPSQMSLYKGGFPRTSISYQNQLWAGKDSLNKWTLSPKIYCFLYFNISCFVTVTSMSFVSMLSKQSISMNCYIVHLPLTVK